MEQPGKYYGLIMVASIKDRLLRNWSLRRVMYLVVGSLFVAQGIHQYEWIPIIAGGYFAFMGLLGFGCAATGCCNIPPPSRNK